MKAYITNPDSIHTFFGLGFIYFTEEEYEKIINFWNALVDIETTNCEEQKEYLKKFGNLNAFFQCHSRDYLYIEFFTDDIEQIISYCEMWQEELNIIIEGL